ncbi:N-formylglutamate amidohydrolase [Sphingomonas sp. NSE70-1]|uniref:N-formylglutamate amidohydrolase n=1 Tax=Sphingomonas caseinilyticus TaxID=2908205 RepID=A0ABT0RXC5_9SPHN|nr:N-formylglutamate amidohydrolase [Sphingomonas caseinilyticus]MCL6699546.1 N-formylglutamate amidohydrolase [Sphingomonas caseinilyticus]
MRPYPPATLHPSRGSLPVLLSVPHAGREYDAVILANAAQGRQSLEMLEDPFVDRLCWRAIGAGIGTVVQNVPRAVIDCNREEEEVDPAVIENVSPAPVGPRARYGLGLIPSRTHRHGTLWRRRIDRAELQRRIDEVHRPYHHLLEKELEALTGRFGEAVLIDCHSMPSRAGQAEMVIGDRHGASAATWLCEEAARIARKAGFRTALNDPYAGGAIVARHGRPAAGVHAIQLEIDRATYLDRDGRTPGVGLDRIAGFLEMLAIGLGEALLSRGIKEAAE